MQLLYALFPLWLMKTLTVKHVEWCVLRLRQTAVHGFTVWWIGMQMAQNKLAKVGSCMMPRCMCLGVSWRSDWVALSLLMTAHSHSGANWRCAAKSDRQFCQSLSRGPSVERHHMSMNYAIAWSLYDCPTAFASNRTTAPYIPDWLMFWSTHLFNATCLGEHKRKLSLRCTKVNVIENTWWMCLYMYLSSVTSVLIDGGLQSGRVFITSIIAQFIQSQHRTHLIERSELGGPRNINELK